MNKQSIETNSIYRISSSLDFAAAARSVLVVGKNPADPDHSVLAPVKCNLAKGPPSLGYIITDDGLEWEGEVDLAADSLLSASTKQEVSADALAEAEEFLIDGLADGPMPSGTIISQAEQAGIRERTLKRAKTRLNIVAQRVGEEGKQGGGYWCWALPDDPEREPASKG